MSRLALAVVALGLFISVSAEYKKDNKKCVTCGTNIDTSGVQYPDHIQNNYGRSSGRSYSSRNDRANEGSRRHDSDYRRDGGRSEEDGSRRNHEHRENGGSDYTSDRHDRDRHLSSNNHYQKSSHTWSNRGDSRTDIRHSQQNPVEDGHHNRRSYHNSHGYDNSHRRRDDDDGKISYSHRRFSSSRQSDDTVPSFRRGNVHRNEDRGYGSSNSRIGNRLLNKVENYFEQKLDKIIGI